MIGRIAAAALLLAACSAPPAPKQEIPADVVPLVDQLVVRHGPIGIEGSVQGTYVLVDVENRTARDRIVAADGALKDMSGRELVALAADEVRIPAGQRRTLSLVSIENLPNAVGANVRIKGAQVAEYPDPILVEDFTSATEDGVLTARARLHNTARGLARVNAFCSFYDAQGHILARTFRQLDIAGQASQTVSYTGPPGATRAVIYPGDELF